MSLTITTLGFEKTNIATYLSTPSSRISSAIRSHLRKRRCQASGKDLEDLHRLGILVRDINIPNYLGGKLVDFSRAWTTPHPWCKAMWPETAMRQRQSDPHSVLDAIFDLGIEQRWNLDVLIPDELRTALLGIARTTALAQIRGATTGESGRGIRTLRMRC